MEGQGKKAELHADARVELEISGVVNPPDKNE
jgi:hypothetical protein